MEIYLENREKRDLRKIKTSFDWPAFVSPWIYGIPHFLRGQITVGIALFVLSISSLWVYMPGVDEQTLIFSSICYLVFAVFLSIYLGKNGRKMLTKHLLENNYDFVNSDSDIVQHFKDKWQII